MRWDNLSLSSETDPAPELPLGLAGATVRRFDTPGFRGITFFEIRAKSIINKVPGGSQVPFQWTINPYRGCSHACVYCLSGATPILLADGRTKALSEIRVGDEVYGTTTVGAYRRYVTTKVLAHWSTVKPAYRLILADGTSLIASGDHRFLTDRGWKFVTGAMSGSGRRPYLTINNKLMGTGCFAEPPKDSAAYRRGYLCGMMRGDGHVGSYSYDRPGRVHGDVHRFRLALIDAEGLDRTQRYLSGYGVHTTRFEFQAPRPRRRAISAIRASARDAVDAVRRLIAWPSEDDADWQKGFLAGIFDAEGSCSDSLRIAHIDPHIIAHVTAALGSLGFRFVVEPTRHADGLCHVRLLGGTREQLRFFLTTDPAIRRKRSIEGRAIKHNAPLQVVSIEELGIALPMYDITTGTGDFIANGVVSHNCFARNSHTYLDLDAGRDFDSRVVVKVNAPELLRTELAAPRWSGDHIAMGTNVDCYQRAEGRYQLMPRIIEALRDHANPFSILTKGTLIVRDIPLLRRAAEATKVGVAMSIGFVDEQLWRSVEPGTPSPRRRLDAVRALVDAGFACGVLMAPILPGLTDTPEQIDRTVAAIAAAGARSVTPLPLHLRTGAREWYMGWLRRTRPELVEGYEQLYRRGAYSPDSYQRQVAARVRQAARRHGLSRPSSWQVRQAESAATSSGRGPPPGDEPRQLTLL
ncbi:MAG: intein-containing Rv2578c family radical SAM protein [Micromonosporaceae bacterium]